MQILKMKKCQRLYLKALRKKHHFSMEDVSETIEISLNYYQMLESGTRGKRFSLEVAARLSNLFNLSLNDFYQMELVYLDPCKTMIPHSSVLSYD